MDYHITMLDMKFGLIGVGGTGTTIIDGILGRVNRGDGKTIPFALALDSSERDLDDLEHVPHADRLLLGEQRVKGHGAGTDRELGREIVEADLDLVQDRLDTYQTHRLDGVLLVGSVAGGTGGGGLPVLAAHLDRLYANFRVYGLAVLPATDEGTIYRENAVESIPEFRDATDGLFAFDNGVVDTDSMDEFSTHNDALITRIEPPLTVQQADRFQSDVDPTELHELLSASGFIAVSTAEKSIRSDSHAGGVSSLLSGSDTETQREPNQVVSLVQQAFREQYTLPITADDGEELVLLVGGPSEYLHRNELRRARRWLDDHVDASVHLNSYTYDQPRLTATLLIGTPIESIAQNTVVDQTAPDSSSELTEINGVTEETATALRRAGYGSIDALRTASQDELARVNGIGKALAARIKADLDALSVDESATDTDSQTSGSTDTRRGHEVAETDLDDDRVKTIIEELVDDPDMITEYREDVHAMLRSDRSALRKAGARLLAETDIIHRQPTTVEPLIKELPGLLDDEDEEIRKYTVSAYSSVAFQFPEDVHTVIDDLRPFLRADDPDVRESASVALLAADEHRTDADRSTISLLEAELESETPSVREQAAQDLATMAAHGPEFVAPVFEKLWTHTDETSVLTKAGLETYTHICRSSNAAVESPPSIDNLGDFLTDDEPAVRAQAAEVLGAIAGEQPEQVRSVAPDLEAALDDPEPNIRLFAADALWALDMELEEPVRPPEPVFADLVAVDDSAVQKQAVSSLKWLASSSPEYVRPAVDDLAELTRYDDEEIADAAIEALWQLSAELPEAVRPVAGELALVLTEDARETLFDRYPDHVREDFEQAQRLKDRADDDPERVADASDDIRELLHSEVRETRRRTMTAIAKTAPQAPATLTPLVDDLRDLLFDDDAYIRSSALEAIAAIVPELSSEKHALVDDICESFERNDSSDMDHLFYAEALQAIAEDSPQAVGPAVDELVQIAEGGRRGRSSAAYALRDTAAADPAAVASAVGTLQELLNKRMSVRVVSAETLAYVAKEDPSAVRPAIPALKRQLEEGDDETQVAAAKALNTLRDRYPGEIRDVVDHIEGLVPEGTESSSGDRDRPSGHDITRLPSVDEGYTGSRLREAGYETVGDLQTVTEDDLVSISGIVPSLASRIIDEVEEYSTKDGG
jgi:cell division GTPase FtsZ